MAYTELYFTDCYWPDFDNAELQLALDDFSQRKRRYGGHSESDELTVSSTATSPRVLSGQGA
jgi:undecaprenyl diphosphate synthase